MMNLSIYIFAATYITRGKLAPTISTIQEEPFVWGLTTLIVSKHRKILMKN